MENCGHSKLPQGVPGWVVGDGGAAPPSTVSDGQSQHLGLAKSHLGPSICVCVCVCAVGSTPTKLA